MVTKSNGVILGQTSIRGNTKCIRIPLVSFVFLCIPFFSSAFPATKSNGVPLGKTDKFFRPTTPLLLVGRYYFPQKMTCHNRTFLIEISTFGLLYQSAVGSGAPRAPSLFLKNRIVLLRWGHTHCMAMPRYGRVNF